MFAWSNLVESSIGLNRRVVIQIDSCYDSYIVYNLGVVCSHIASITTAWGHFILEECDKVVDQPTHISLQREHYTNLVCESSRNPTEFIFCRCGFRTRDLEAVERSWTVALRNQGYHPLQTHSSSQHGLAAQLTALSPPQTTHPCQSHHQTALLDPPLQHHHLTRERPSHQLHQHTLTTISTHNNNNLSLLRPANEYWILVTSQLENDTSLTVMPLALTMTLRYVT